MNVHSKQQEVQLLKDYDSLIKRIVGGWIRKLPPNIHRDDLLNECRLALIETWRRWGSAYGTAQFEVHVRIRMRGAVIDYLRDMDLLSRRIRQEQSAQDFEGSKITFVAYEALDAEQGRRIDAECATYLDVEEAIDRRRRPERLQSVLPQIPKRDRGILQNALSGKKNKEIAKEEGVSEPRISQLVARAKKRARKLLAA